MKLCTPKPIFTILTLALLIIQVEAAGFCTSYSTLIHFPKQTGSFTDDAYQAAVTNSKNCKVFASAAPCGAAAMVPALLAAVTAVMLLP